MARLDPIPVGHRLRYLDLLLLADEAADRVAGHLDDGELLVWVDDGTGEALGAVQAVPLTASLWELVLVAVGPDHQGRGVGTAMLDAVLDTVRERGARRVVVGTAAAGVRQLAFYQRAGFRVFAVERDHFDAARGYGGTETENGIVIRDLIWLDQLMTP